MKTLSPKAEYIVKNGKPTAVIMPIAEYEELLEDLHDLGGCKSLSVKCSAFAQPNSPAGAAERRRA